MLSNLNADNVIPNDNWNITTYTYQLLQELRPKVYLKGLVHSN